MSISKKEMRMLIALALLGVLAAVYFFLYQPFQEKNASLKVEMESLQAELNLGMQKIEGKTQIEKNLEEQSRLFDELTGAIYGEMDQEIYLLKFNEFVEKAGIQMIGLEYNDDEDIEITAIPLEEGETTDESQTSATESQTNTTASALTAGHKSMYTVNIECTYKQLMDLLRMIEENEKLIVCSGIAIKAEDVDGLNNNMSVGSSALAALPDKAKDLPDSYLDSEVICQLNVDFWYMSGLDEYTIGADYVSEFVRSPVQTTKGISPFKRVHN